MSAGSSQDNYCAVFLSFVANTFSIVNAVPLSFFFYIYYETACAMFLSCFIIQKLWRMTTDFSVHTYNVTDKYFSVHT